MKGDGIEYADIRDFVPGDRAARDQLARVGTPRGSLVVNERHPERNTDVVLFVDSFVDVRARGRSTLDDAVRATATLAGLYLERRDRVGLVAFGGMLRWLQPGMGPIQRYRLIETLLETGVGRLHVAQRERHPGAHPAAEGARLRDDAARRPALRDHGRGPARPRYDVAVVEVDPVPLVEPGPTEVERLAYRLWLLEREVLRARLARLGIAVATLERRRRAARPRSRG